MYTKYNEPSVLIDAILPEANKFVMEFDRSQYEPFLRAAEMHVSMNGGVLGDTIAEQLLGCHKSGTTPVPTRDSYNYTIYLDPAACNPIKWARDLADIMAKVESPLAPTVSLTTAVYRYEFNISINTRSVVKMLVMNPFRGNGQFIKIVKPPRVRGFYADKLYVLDAEMLLVSIYRELHKPLSVAKWHEIAAREHTLADTVVEDVSKKVFGGGAHDGIPWMELSGVIWVGDVAVSYHSTGALPDDCIRPQVLTDMFADDLILMIEKIIPRIGGRKLTYTQNTPGIAGDPQLIKITIFDESQGRKTSILDAYNATAYDMVPYIEHDGIMIAGVWPTLRMLFTDLWVLRSVESTEHIQRRINTILVGINTLREVAWRDLIGASSHQKYLGTPKTDLDARRARIMAGQRMAPYYPSKGAKKGGDETSDQTDQTTDDHAHCEIDLPPFIGPFGSLADPATYLSNMLPDTDNVAPFLAASYARGLLIRSAIRVNCKSVDVVSPVCCVDDGPDLLDTLRELTGSYDFVHFNGVLHHSSASMMDISAELKRIAPVSTVVVSDITCCPEKSLRGVGITARRSTRLVPVVISSTMAAAGYSKLFENISGGQFVMVFKSA